MQPPVLSQLPQVGLIGLLYHIWPIYDIVFVQRLLHKALVLTTKSLKQLTTLVDYHHNAHKKMQLILCTKLLLAQQTKQLAGACTYF